ncbi:MAG: hypothetical protein N2043_13160 [Ignavibacterium sp.]|nr:hypothetical protein [Ignavibacterium sp.]
MSEIVFVIFIFYTATDLIIYFRIRKHIKVYYNIFKTIFDTDKKIDDIDKYLNNWNNYLSNELKLLFGEKRNENVIKEIILKDLSKDNSTLITLINLSPAIGLLFTFIGLYSTLSSFDTRIVEDLITHGVFTTIISSLGYLAPVFIAGAIGIFLYIVGLLFFSSLEKKQLEKANELNIIYHTFEAQFYPFIGIDFDKIYHKLLKPLNRTLYSLRQINVNFNELGNSISNYVRTLKENTDSFIKAFSDLSLEVVSRFESQSVQLMNTITNSVINFSNNIEKFNRDVIFTYQQFNEQNGNLLGALRDNFGELNKLHNILSDYVTGIENLKGKLNNLGDLVDNFVKFNKYFSSIQEKIDKNVDALVKNSEIVRHSVNETSNLFKNVNEIEKLVNKQLSQSETIIRLLDKYDLDRLVNKIDESLKKFLSELIHNLNQGVTVPSPNPVSSYNGSDNKLEQIIQELKRSNDLLNYFKYELSKPKNKKTFLTIINRIFSRN